MSFGLQSSYKFTWILEDIDSWFGHRDYVRSPFFTSEKVLKETAWCIYLHGLKESMKEDSLCLYLNRRDSLPGKIRLYVLMFLVMPDDTQKLIDKQRTCIFESGEGFQFNIGYTFHTLRKLFYDDTLKIQCEIVNPSELVVSPEQFTARTRLGTEVINCLWEIQSFLSFPTFSSPFPSIQDSSHRLEIKGISWVRDSLISLPRDGDLQIKIGTVDEDIASSAHVEGEISLLNAEKEIVLSTDSKHIFLSGAQKKNWNFVIPFSKKKIVEVCDICQTNEQLSLICKFTFYTILNESFEYTSLPRSLQTVVRKKNQLISPQVAADLKKLDEAFGYSNLPRWQPMVSKRTTQDLLPSARLVKGLERLNMIEDVEHHLQEDLEDLYMRKSYCDVVLKAGTQSFPSHKIILCSRSPVFKDMFDEDLRKRKQEEVIIDLEADTMNQFLFFLYSEKLDNLRWESAIKLLHAANKFQVESLKIECCSFLKSQLCVSNVCEALIFAFEHQNFDLRGECEEFIFENASEVFTSAEWKAFALKYPLYSSDIIQRYFNLNK